MWGSTARVSRRGCWTWRRTGAGPLALNDGVYATLRHFEEMDREASPQVLANWRFQQAQYRAHYDAYTRARLLYETEVENRAMSQLRAARGTGSLAAMTQAEETLDRAASSIEAIVRLRRFAWWRTACRCIR
jgi:hypothetical protein